MNRPDKFIYAPTKEEAKNVASAHGDVTDVQPLPYPPIDTPDGMPGFCYIPEKCAGHTSCPRSRACSE